MKKLLSLLLALALLFSLSACMAEASPTTEYEAPSQSESESSSAEKDTEGSSAPEATSELTPEDPTETASEETGETEQNEPEASSTEPAIEEDSVYTSKEDVALYIYTYGHLPSNFMRKRDAQALGWEGGSLEPYAPGMCIGGDRFGNYEGLLPEAEGRTYTECDIDTLGAERRGAKRIVFSNDGLIYYTDDHYESFTLLYGEEEP